MSTYRAPTAIQVDEAMRRITKSQLRRAFFEGIENPLWVKPLADAGAFKNPPEPERTEDGYTREVYWPEGDFLSRVAVQAPQEVVDVLLSLAASTNSWVRRALFEIGAKIPAEYAVQLRPVIRSWQSSGLGWRTDPRDLVLYAVNLLQGGQREAGTWFANLIFKPSKAKSQSKPTHVLEEYWYEEGLPKVVEVLEPADLELLLSWLRAFERESGHLTKKFDMSHYSRDSIRQATESAYPIEQALIDAVRDLAVESMLADPEKATKVLLASSMLLARKIALFSLSEALARLDPSDERRALFLSVADQLLTDQESTDDSCRIDYAELARAVARDTGESLAFLTEVIDAGPDVDLTRLRDWVGEGATSEADVDERVKEYLDHWKHRWLSALGTEALPAQLQTLLSELDTRFGVIDRPLTPTKHLHSWTGPTSPLRQDEMLAMTPAELAAHLESWHSIGTGRGREASHEGQGRELQSVLATNPTALVGAEDLVDRLRPTYLRAILQGWEAAIKADLPPDWTQVADLIEAVLRHEDASGFPPEGGRWDDDADFRSAKRAAVGLLETLAQKRPAMVVPEGTMARFAEMLISLADDETAWSEYIGSGEESGMDALTTSLNWQWPVRLRGLIHLMSRGKDSGWYDAAQAALEADLARNDTRHASRAVLGEGVGRLFDVDPEWTTMKAPEWFGSTQAITSAQQVALTTAMAVHRYHSKLYDLLSDPMLATIEAGEPIVSGWDHHADPIQRIGEWVIDAIIRGHRTSDDPVATSFFSSAPAKVRGESIGHIAWAFLHAESVDDDIRDRFADLWDQRVAHVREHPEDKDELHGFHWFVKSHKFATEWWLPRLKEAAELDPDLSAERYIIGKEVASSADVDPRGAFDALRLLLQGRDEAGMVSWDLTRNAVPMVIARAIESDDDTLRQEAIAYMNMLGEKGNLSLEAEVNKVRQGAITQNDVDG